jgi:RNA polymerase sigma factor (sigma-70 family)
MSQTLSERIETLTPHLRRIARQHAQDPMQADDIFQHMAECILKQADPTDSNSRILTLATWRARNFVESEQVYLTYVSDEGVLQGQGDGDEEQDSPFDTYQAPDQSVHGLESEVIEAEVSKQLQDLIAKLPTENKRLISLLSAGEKPADIARKLGVSRSAISQRLKSIRTWLQNEGIDQLELQAI